MSIHISKIVVLLMLTGSAFGQQSKPSPPKQDARLALAGRLIDVTIHPASKGLRRLHGKRSTLKLVQNDKGY